MVAHFEKSRHDLPACCRLPLSVDHVRILDELDFGQWAPERGQSSTIRPRYFLVGTATRDDDSNTENTVLERMPYTRDVLYNILPGKPLRAHFSIVPAATVVPAHVDGKNRHDFFNRTLRLHIPIVTNTQARLMAAGRFYHLAAGEVWVLNNFVEHGVLNDHPKEARVHLIVDSQPDDLLLGLVDGITVDPGELDAECLDRLRGSAPRRPWWRRLAARATRTQH